jgi:hypothetical protein
VNLVLDAGGLIGIERDVRRVAALVELGRRAGAQLVTVAPVVGQVWRGGARQTRLARAMGMLDVRSTDLAGGQLAGELLAATRSVDVVDALVALAAVSGDQILTSDPADLRKLVRARRVPCTIVAV